MTPLQMLRRLRLRELWNKLRTFVGDHPMRFVTMSIIAGIFWIGLYFMFASAFGFLEQYEVVRELVVNTVLSMFFFALMFMLAFSNGIISFGSLFKSEETVYLMVTPVKVENIFLYKFWDTVIFSSWAFLFLGTPFMAAYGVSRGAPWEFYLIIVFLFFIFMFVPAGLGVIATLVVARWAPRNRRSAVLCLLGIALICLTLIGSNLLEMRGMVKSQPTVSQVQELFTQFSFTQHPLLPSYWMTKAVVAFSTIDPEVPTFGIGVKYSLILASTALFVCTFAYWMAWKVYYPAWYLSAGLKRSARARRGNLALALLRPILSTLSDRVRLLVVKDIKTFLRDPTQWSQCLIFFGLLTVYFFNLRNLNYDDRPMRWRNLIAQLNLGATCMTLSTFTSRFIFPQISLEGRRFWSLGMAPMKYREILYGKFIFSLLGSVIIAEALIFLSTLQLEVPIEIVMLHAITVLGVCVGLSGLSVGLGAIYPQFNEDNPSKIISGFGGTLNLILSFVFVFGLVLIQAIPCFKFYSRGAWTQEMFNQTIGYAVAAILILSVLFAAIPLWKGIQRIERIEV